MKKTLPRTLKGFRDFLPEEAMKRQWLKDKITSVFKLWGYDPLETPTLEPLEIFEGQIGEGEKMFYKFTDFGGRKVALRYDQSIPTSRVIGQYHNQLPMPFKRFQIQSAFRAENTQKGRYREFLQCDADIFGIASPLADAEVIALTIDIYKKIGFTKFKTLISDRALLSGIPYEGIIAIDKIKKIGKEGVIETMLKKGIPKEKALEYMDLAQNIKPNETLKIILEYLKSYGFDDSLYQFDPTIARSFSYSSGPIWEVEIEGFLAGSVLGGERYDNVVENISGIKVEATGFAVGFDRTLEAAEQFGLVPSFKTFSEILITIFSKNMWKQSLKIAQFLRNKGINTEIYPDNTVKLDKQLKYADKKGIPYVAIIGPTEAENNSVTLKNLKTKRQEVITFQDLPARIATRSVAGGPDAIKNTQ